MSDLIDRQATIDAIPEQKLWKERYEDLLEYFHGEDIILKDRKEFKAWLERIHWHVLECDKLARQLEEQPEIIRCKNCKHKPYPSDNYDYDNSGFEIIFPDYRCPCRCEDEYYNHIPDDDWFCGNAERRTDE